jgi:hypothetical protein
VISRPMHGLVAAFGIQVVSLADKVEVVWAVPLQRVMSAPACVRNAGIVNRASVECPACRSSVRRAEPH